MADPILPVAPVAPVAPIAAPATPAPIAQTTVPVSNTPYAAPMTPIQATQLVNQYGIDPTQVLSAQNIQQTIKAPAPAPDDLLGIRRNLYASEGVNTAQEAFIAAQKAASSAALGLNERLTGLRGRSVSLSKITGTQAQERAVSQGEIDALNESARIAANDYAAKKGNADEMFQIRNQEISEKKQIMLQYPGAGVGFGDSFSTVSKKLTKYQDKVAKDEWKQKLKLLAMETGASLKSKHGGTASVKTLENNIAKVSKSKLKMAEQEFGLKMEALKMDIANTKSTIAERNKKSSDMTPYYVFDPSSGSVKQVFNDDGTPLMVPKNAQISNMGKQEEAPNFSTPQQQEESPWWKFW